MICFDNLTGQWSKWPDYGLLTDVVVTTYWYENWLNMDTIAPWRNPSNAKHMDVDADLRSDHQTMDFVMFDDSK